LGAAVPVVALFGLAQLPIQLSATPHVRMSLATRAVSAGIYRAVGTQGRRLSFGVRALARLNGRTLVQSLFATQRGRTRDGCRSPSPLRSPLTRRP